MSFILARLIYQLLIFVFSLAIVYLTLNKNIENKNHFLKVLLFSFYVFTLLSLTEIGTIYNLIGGVQIEQDFINLIPFRDMRMRITMILSLLNILVFVPLGFLLPIVWPKSDNFKSAFLIGFSLSFLIETAQMLNFRRTDIDDLIFNTLGAILGYLIFRLINKTINLKSNRMNYFKYEPYLYIISIYLGMFLFYNEQWLRQIMA